MHACIVGAGLAGLAAAEALSVAGARVDVIEARPRIGGRVWSETLTNGAVVERGGEFILEGYDLTRALASRVSISLAPTGMAYGDREPRGGPPVSRTELFEISRVLARAAESAPARASLGDLLDRLEMSPGVRAAIESRLSISTGHDARELASHLAGHTSSTFSPTESVRVAGGNMRLAEALAGALPGPVRTSHVAAEVRWEEASVTVAGPGFSIDCDAAVITIPATVLDGLSFEPPLPASKTAAYASVDYGHAAKLFVPLRHAVSPSAVMSVPDRFWCWTACGLDEKVQPVVSCFAGSAAALELLRVDEGPGVWLDRLGWLRPDLELVHDEAVCSTWDDDPWMRGAYSVELAGRPRDHRGLEQPVGPLFFAGEHTAGPWAGTIEGALRSGRRAAEQVIAHAGMETT